MRSLSRTIAVVACLALIGCRDEELPPPGDFNPVFTNPGTGGGAPTSYPDAGNDDDGGTRCLDVCGTPDCGLCPQTPMVTVGAFEIDATEVTNADYAVFLATRYTTADQPAACGLNTTFTPSKAWPVVDGGTLPVVWVDWCDAWSYCEWAGKRLCGRPGGGTTPFESSGAVDPAQSQWFSACSNGATRFFPYGNVFNSMLCNVSLTNRNSVAPVGSFPGCVGGGSPGLFDMSGNVEEWEDSCKDSLDYSALCHVRGGSFTAPETWARCDNTISADLRRNSTAEIGIRCCKH